MTRARTTFAVGAIDTATAAALRDVDDAGRAPRFLVEEEGGSPLRCCLRLSRPGERIALLSYAPLRRFARTLGADPGAYDEVGPVFVHADPCEGPAGDGYPEELRAERRLLRAYAGDGRILRGVLVEANGPFEDVLDELVSDPQVAVVHARAVEFGCFTFEVRRR
jgi:hypothetical protein